MKEPKIVREKTEAVKVAYANLTPLEQDDVSSLVSIIQDGVNRRMTHRRINRDYALEILGKIAILLAERAEAAVTVREV